MTESRGQLLGSFHVSVGYVWASCSPAFATSLFAGRLTVVQRLSVILVAFIVLSLVIWAVLRIYAVCVFERGIRGFTVFGSRPYARWEDIVRAEYLDGGQHIGISTRDVDFRVSGRLRESESFRATIEKGAGAEHCLTKLLAMMPSEEP